METFTGQLAMCDVCAEYVGNDEPRLRTFVGTTAQSDVCMDCARLIRQSLDNIEAREFTETVKRGRRARREAVTA